MKGVECGKNPQDRENVQLEVVSDDNSVAFGYLYCTCLGFIDPQSRKCSFLTVFHLFLLMED